MQEGLHHHVKACMASTSCSWQPWPRTTFEVHVHTLLVVPLRMLALSTEVLRQQCHALCTKYQWRLDRTITVQGPGTAQSSPAQLPGSSASYRCPHQPAHTWVWNGSKAKQDDETAQPASRQSTEDSRT